MEKQQKNRRLSLGVIAGVSVASLALGGGATWWVLNSLTTSTPTSVTTTNQPSVTSQTIQAQKAEVYWLDAAGSDIKLLPTQIDVETKSTEKTVETALNLLLAGPKQANYTTTIPEGTKLLNLFVEKDGIHVDLSQEFTSGGGSESMTMRLAQILYTATSASPNAPVWLNVEGEPLEVLGGEGVEINQPMTRQQLAENFPL